MDTFDTAVIGAGPGGYVAAIRCAQLGMRTVCIDAWRDASGKPSPGGTCANVGCIPSKALLDSSHHYHNVAHLLPLHGVDVQGASVNIETMLARKDKVVRNLTRGVAGLLKKNKVTFINGHARLIANDEIAVSTGEGSTQQTIKAKHIIIATGSLPVDIPVAKLDHEHIVDNAGALAFSEVPERLGIIGGGVIGLELGSVWNRLGSEVFIWEALPEFLSLVDRDIAKAAERSCKKQGLNIHLGARVSKAEARESGVQVQFEDGEGNKAMEVDKLVVAVGRRPNTEGLGCEDIGIPLDDRGRIQVDELCRTSAAGVYAIGDVVQGPMLAHKASEEGVAVAELIAGQSPHIDHAIIPWVIYTHPEIAWVGQTEQELAAKNVEYRTGTFPFAASGRAQAAAETEGLVKVIGHAQTDRILGVHIFGAQASELIAEAVTAMAFHGSTEDLARTVHAHPTLAETIHEAALSANERGLHM